MPRHDPLPDPAPKKSRRDWVLLAEAALICTIVLYGQAQALWNWISR